MDSWNSAGPSKSEMFDELASVLKALANGRRLELVEMMAQGEHSVDELARLCGMGVSAASAHLQTLKRVGLVRTRREGSSVFYALAGDDVAAIFLAAKRTGMARSAQVRETVGAYLGQIDGEEPTPLIDPSAVTSTMTVLDVRPLAEYEAGHFPGAISIPMPDLENRWGELPLGAEVVLYCRGELCRMSREAARWLVERGVDAKAMDEGVVEWRVSKGVDLDVA